MALRKIYLPFVEIIGPMLLHHYCITLPGREQQEQCFQVNNTFGLA